MSTTVMANGDTGRRPDLARLLDEVKGVASLPQVTARIVSTLDDPDRTPQQLHNIIAHDPALTARLLKVVNSPFIGMWGRISTIERAIVVLGERGVKNIAIAASLGALFDSTEVCKGFLARDLWVHSIAVAVAARDLARATRFGAADEAFLAALVHDIGLLVALQAHPRQFQAVCDLARVEGGPDFCALERQIIGFDHQELGMGLAARWRLPRSCQLAAGGHHQLTGAPADRNHRLLTLVHVADTLCCHAGQGFNLTALHQPLDAEMLVRMRIDPMAVHDTRQRLDALVAQGIAHLE